VPNQPITRATRALLPLAAAILLAPAGWAQPTEAPASPKPFPAIEAGMHTAIINRIAVDRAGRWAVTASDDKTARVWDLRTGALLQVLRVPVGEGTEGMLYAVALSPDGELVALGGWTDPAGTSIYLFDRTSGRLRQRLAGLPNVVNRPGLLRRWPPPGRCPLWWQRHPRVWRRGPEHLGPGGRRWRLRR